MRRSTRQRIGATAAWLLLLCTGGTCPAAELSLFDWLGTAPVVVAGQNIDSYGKFAEFRVEHSLRGEQPVGSVIRVGVRWANRERNRELQREALRFDAGSRYLLLLAPAQMKKVDHEKPAFALVRGVEGAREIPAEGAAPMLEAVREFVELQHANSDDVTWERMSRMLESTNPFMLDTALDQHLKFRRGTLRELESLRPLISHPAPETRIRALGVAAMIIERAADQTPPEAALLRLEFGGRARRDEDARVRTAAVEALSRLNLPGVDSLLEEIARDDPDQGVRYMAERRLLEREEDRAALSEKGGGPR